MARGAEAVLFDFDGTLADTIDLILKSYDHAVTAYGYEHPDPEVLRKWIGVPLVDTFQSLFPGLPDAAIEVYDEWSREHVGELVEIFPGMDELLADLAAAGIATGIVTSRRRDSFELVAGAVGVLDLVPVTVTADEGERHKPDPAPLLQAARLLGVEPMNATYVGDAVVDVQAAKAAGMRAIVLPRGAATEDELCGSGPDALLHSTAELRELLLR
jgi:pyrophosphatase PpaX